MSRAVGKREEAKSFTGILFLGRFVHIWVPRKTSRPILEKVHMSIEIRRCAISHERITRDLMGGTNAGKNLNIICTVKLEVLIWCKVNVLVHAPPYDVFLANNPSLFHGTLETIKWSALLPNTTRLLHYYSHCDGIDVPALEVLP
jgi:hypothetical protein